MCGTDANIRKLNNNLVLPEIEWTDGDLQCMFRKLSDVCFSYAEVRLIAPDEYVFCAKAVNINNCPPPKIEDIVTTYYSGGTKEIKKTYKEKAIQIITECIFESLPLEDMDYVSDSFDNEYNAASKMCSYVSEQLNILRTRNTVPFKTKNI